MYWEIITYSKVLVSGGMLNVMSVFMFCTRTVIALSN